MRWRMIVLGLFAVAMAAGCAVCMTASADLSYRAQRIFGDVQTHPPTLAQQEESDRMWQQSSGLSLLVTPLAVGSLVGLLAIPAVLARRWQPREQ